MNICGQNNSYSPDHYIFVAGRVRKYNKGAISESDFKKEIENVFTPEDAKRIIDWVKNNPGITFPASFSDEVKTTKSDRNDVLLQINPFDGSVSYYYSTFGGNARMDSEDLQKEIDTELVFNLVYNPDTKTIIHPNANSRHFGYTEINYRLRQLKFNYIKNVINLFKLDVVPDIDFDDNVEFTKLTNRVIRDALTKLIHKNWNNDNINKAELDAFIKLAQFDELVLNSNFVKLKDGQQNNNVFSKTRYEFTGETVKYARSMYEEHADANDYTSKLVSSILNAIEYADHEYNNIPVKIGTDGFNYAIAAVNNWIEKEGLLTNAEIPYYERIDLYLNNTNPTKTLKHILYGLRKNIFNEDAPNEIQQLFSAQAETTVRAMYQEYMLGNIKIVEGDNTINVPGVAYNQASDRIVDQTKSRIAGLITSKLRYLEQNKDVRERSKQILGFSIELENGIVICRHLGGGYLKITKNNDGFSVTQEGIDANHNDAWARFLNEIADLPLLDTSEWSQLLADGELLPMKFSNLIATISFAVCGDFTNVKTKDGLISYVKVLPLIEKEANFMIPLYNDEARTIVKDQEGHNIPSHQMVSLGYRTQHLIDDVKRSPDHIQSENYIVRNRKCIKSTSLRKSGKVGNIVRSAQDMTFVENEQVKTITDFYQHFLRDGNIVLQPMVYADKTRHLIYEIVTPKINVDDLLAYDAIKYLIENFKYDDSNSKATIAEKAFLNEIRYRRTDAIIKSLESIVYRFSSVLGLNRTGNLKDDIDSINAKLEKDYRFNKDLKNDEALSKLFSDNHIDFYIENDISVKSKGGFSYYQINSMLSNMYDILSDDKSAENYFNKRKYEYFIALHDNNFKLSVASDPSLQTLYFDKLNSSAKQKWINSAAGTMKLALFRNQNNAIIDLEKVTIEDIASGKIKVELNPLLNGYFWSMNLFGEQLRVLQMGQDYNISGKGDGDIAIENKFIANSKRAMGQGSTIMKFHKQTFGINNFARGCVYDDVIAPVFNPKGEVKDELVADGYGIISPIQFILEQWSLPGQVALRGDIGKTIIQYVDSKGALNQIKWAANTLSNLRRRNCLYANTGIDLSVMFKKMHSDQITMLFDLSDYYGKSISEVDDHIITCNEDIYFKDQRSGKHYKIISVSNVGNNVTRTIAEVNANGTIIGNIIEEPEIYINSLYDLHELFGGMYCETFNQATQTLEYSEINNNILANIVCANNLKNKFVGYAVSKSAMKVGLHNINPSNIFDADNLDPIWEIEINLSHAGVQLDAGHEVSDGHVTEGSQMISLVTERGFATDIVDELYRQIAKVTNEGLTTLKDKNQTKAILSKILIDSLESGTGNIASITDDFIKQLKDRAKENGQTVELYFSSPDIRSKFATAVCASLNRFALRRKYAGLGAVQAASYDHVTTSIVGGYNLTMDDLIDEYRDSLPVDKDISYLFRESVFTPKNELSNSYFESLRSIKSKSDNIPVMEALPQVEGMYQQVYFEDTIVYNDGTKWVAEKIEDIEKYDKFRHWNGQIYRWNTRPRNLVQQMPIFTVVDGVDQNLVEQWTIYDLQEYKLLGYLIDYKNNYSKQDPNDQTVIRRRAFLTSNGINISSVNIDEEIEKCQKRLQDVLINITTSLKSGNKYTTNVNGIEKYIVNSDNNGAEIMIGNPWLAQFDLIPSDSLYKILKSGPKFFEDRLKGKYKSNIPDVARNKYDAILYEADGTPILVQFGSEVQNEGRLEDLYEGNSFKKINGTLVYNGSELGSDVGFKEFVYDGISGHSYKVIRLSDPSRLNSLLKTKLFDKVVYKLSEKSNLTSVLSQVYGKYIQNGVAIKTFRIGNVVINKETKLDFNHLQRVNPEFVTSLINAFNKEQSDRLKRSISMLATQRFNAFKQVLTCIGTRIPSQSLSSIAKCKIIGFTGSKTNDVYLPRVLTWVAGSDYDIDKFFIMMYEVMADGTLPNLYGHASAYNPIKLEELKKEFKDVSENLEFNVTTNVESGNVVIITRNELNTIVNSGSDAGLQAIAKILNGLKSGKSIDVYIDKSELNELTKESELVNKMVLGHGRYSIVDLANKDLQHVIYLVENIVNDIINHDTSKYAQRYREAAERNLVVNDLSKILSTPSVQIALQTVVSADEGRKVAEKVEEKYQSTQNYRKSFDNPASITEQQIANMVGKMGIAAVAIAKKAYDGISFAFNSTIVHMTNEVLVNNGMLTEQQLKQLESLIISTKDRGEISIANVNFQPLINALNSSVYADLIVRLQAIHNKTNQHSAVDYFSTLMTLATDNAKELLLAKLNAMDENIDFYAYSFAIGHTFGEAADLIKSPLFEIVNEVKKKNLFKPGSEYIRLKHAIAFVNNERHLPTVDASLIRSALLGYMDLSEYSSTSTPFAWLAKNRPDLFRSEFNIDPNNDISDYFEIKHEWSTSKDLTKEEKFIVSQLKTDAEFREYFIKYFEQLPIASNKYDAFQIWNEGEFDYGEDYYNQAFSDSLHLYNIDNLTKQSKYSLLDYVYDWIQILDKVESLKNAGWYKDDEHVKLELEKLSKLSKNANEFAILGRKIFSINQGMKAGDYEEWAWVAGIESAINSEFINKNLSFIPLDWNKFVDGISDEKSIYIQYAEDMIKQYDNIKQTVNILQIVKDNPHFKAMLSTALLARDLLHNSVVSKQIHKIARNINNVAKHTTDSFGVVDYTQLWDNTMNEYEYKRLSNVLSKQEYKAIASAVNERMIFEFFNHLKDVGGLTLKLEKSSMYSIDLIKGNYTLNNKLEFNSNEEIKNIELHTIAGMMNFKRWMDQYVFPTLKQKLPKLGNALQLSEDYNKTWNKSKFAWSVDRGIASARPGEQLYKKKAEIISEFSSIARSNAKNYLKTLQTDITIGDLLYLYNLMVHKDENKGLTFLFSNLAASKNPTDWINKFQSYVRDVDKAKIKAIHPVTGEEVDVDLFSISPSDVFFKMINDDNAWKFGLTKTTNNNGWRNKTSGVEFLLSDHQFSADAPFSLPSIYKNIDYKWKGFEIGIEQKFDVDNIAVIQELVHNMNFLLSPSGVKVYTITKEDLIKYSESNTMMFENVTEDEAERIIKSHGFVFEGNVYVNIDFETGKTQTLVHELMHLICANLHYNPKYSERYHQIVNAVWFGASQDERDDYSIKKYPNKKASDLREEFFVEFIAKEIDKGFKSELTPKLSDKITQQQLKDDVLSSIKDVFDISDINTGESLEELLGRFSYSEINDVIALFKSSLFNFNAYGFDSRNVVLSQEMATLKYKLIKENKIKEECN